MNVQPLRERRHKITEFSQGRNGRAPAKKEARPEPGFDRDVRGRERGRENGDASFDRGRSWKFRRQKLARGPTKYWVSPSANLTSPLMPQVGLNFTSAPTRP